ncbi:DUF397 domain-containing protein [Streptomyces sp. NPDC097617]|uniref:DUF397 domain-containing protein n=1 Tax=Streptomyces sp. NPDC097617 TaxID=3366091 RepID=UPI0037F7052D
MNASALAGTPWFKSSFSAGEQDCVEVAPTPGKVYVRDSKHKQGPVLELSRAGFAGLVTLAATRRA